MVIYVYAVQCDYRSHFHFNVVGYGLSCVCLWFRTKKLSVRLNKDLDAQLYLLLVFIVRSLFLNIAVLEFSLGSPTGAVVKTGVLTKLIRE